MSVVDKECVPQYYKKKLTLIIAEKPLRSKCKMVKKFTGSFFFCYLRHEEAMMVLAQEQFFAVTTPGFEQICQLELTRIGVENTQLVPGGVAFSGSFRDLYLTNLWLRTASRILVRFGFFSVRDFPTLYRRLLRLPWGRFIKPGTASEVRVTCHRSRLSHSGRVADTAKEAIEKALGCPAVEIGPVQKIFLRMEDDHCQVSLDSSGELLHRRGYRVANVTAPLRETLAAGCLLSLGYDGSKPLIDLMTGSGSFPIEAALIALNRAPGLQRNFAFMNWPKYRPALWRQLCELAGQQERRELVTTISGVDNNPLAIAAAEQNLQAAGLADSVLFRCQPMQSLVAPAAPGLLICNPPYGERLGKNASLEALYHDLGRIFGKVFSPWRGGILCPENELIQAVGIPLIPQLYCSNGGIKVCLLKKP